eukprot:927707-Pleurochrysis_carterae.AAC.5
MTLPCTSQRRWGGDPRASPEREANEREGRGRRESQYESIHTPFTAADVTRGVSRGGHAKLALGLTSSFRILPAFLRILPAFLL